MVNQNLPHMCLFVLFAHRHTSSRVMIFHRFTRSLVSANSRHIIQITFAFSWSFFSSSGFRLHFTFENRAAHISTRKRSAICAITADTTDIYEVEVQIGGEKKLDKITSKIIAVIHRAFIFSISNVSILGVWECCATFPIIWLIKRLLPAQTEKCAFLLRITVFCCMSCVGTGSAGPPTLTSSPAGHY